MARPPVLVAIVVASLSWLALTSYGGLLSDRIGRKQTFRIGYALISIWTIPRFLLIETADISLSGSAVFLLTIGLGRSYGPMSAMERRCSPVSVGVCITGTAVVSLAAVSAIRETRGQRPGCHGLRPRRRRVDLPRGHDRLSLTQPQETHAPGGSRGSSRRSRGSRRHISAGVASRTIL